MIGELSADLDPTGLDQQSQACLRMWGACFYSGLMAAADAFVSELKAKRKPRRSCSKNYERELNQAEALRWFYNEENHGAGSFVWLCELFHLDPNRARGVARTKFRELSRREQRANKAALKAGFAVEETLSEYHVGLPDADESDEHTGHVGDVAMDMGILDLLSGGDAGK